ncbi:MAG TPA: choice-of-anchor tandem repeat GloVer-containing protein [Candidatus Cybelea sp.]|nr:choice-of-anchor tandem repeat GloVer-containing protein [Candidatus Cybelea sp.]
MLYSFKGDGSGDGAYPHGDLLDVNGTLYGTTSNGGSSSRKRRYAIGCGTVFAIASSGKETVLHSFGRSGDGKYVCEPHQRKRYALRHDHCWRREERRNRLLVIAMKRLAVGFLIATTLAASAGHRPAYSVLYGFKGPPEDGAFPVAGLVNVNGTLYGATALGGSSGLGGTVFAIATSGAETVLYSSVARETA